MTTTARERCSPQYRADASQFTPEQRSALSVPPAARSHQAIGPEPNARRGLPIAGTDCPRCSLSAACRELIAER